MLSEIGVELSQLETACILQMLVRDIQSHQLIFYRELFDVVGNFMHKQELMLESLRHGIEYRAITQETFNFLLQINSIDL